MLVSRPRLIARLDEGRCQDHKLILISAPAGYGKTTLLGEWIARSELCARVAWVSLDAGDNDPGRFWSYVIAALQTLYDEIGETVQAAFQSPQPPPYKSTLIGLINQIAQVQESFLLVLDDYHAIQAPAIHQALAFMLENLPSQPLGLVAPEQPAQLFLRARRLVLRHHVRLTSGRHPFSSQ